MERYVALLRGVSPMNCKMQELKQCLEAAGFKDVKTILSSGNVAFSAKPEIVPIIEKRLEAAMGKHLNRVFQTTVRPSAFLQSVIAADPFAGLELPANAKRIVTFLLLAFRNITPDCSRTHQDCNDATNQFAITYAEQFEKALT
jgi:uncharacterized protein (DUF1697 family)